MQNQILHSDMNSYYASVECMLNPRLREYPVAVCGSQEERNGIVLAANQHAKKFGVKTGDVIWEAILKCPDLVKVPPQYDQYLKYSAKAKEIYNRYTNQVESYGMDECWLDVTGSCIGSGVEIAEKIRETMKFELGLTVSIGVSFNKIFAKLGSDLKKPDAISVIPKENFRDIIWGLPASDMLGVGRATSEKLSRWGVHTIGDLAQYPVEYLGLGKNGILLHSYANGLDRSPVADINFSVPVQSVGHGITTLADLETTEEVWELMLALAQNIGTKLRQHKKMAYGVAISVKDCNLYSKQYQKQIMMPTQSAQVIAKSCYSLFLDKHEWQAPIRSVTVRAISLEDDDLPIQLTFDCNFKQLEKQESLEKAIEDLRRRFGKNIITHASICGNKKIPDVNSLEIIMPTGVF